MRKASFALAMGVALSACAGEQTLPPNTETRVTPPPLAASPVVETPEAAPKVSAAELQQRSLRGLREALDVQDAKKAAALYTDRAVLKVAGAPADATGPDAIQASYRKLFAAFSSFRSVANRVWIKGEVAIVEWTFTGTHAGDLYGFKATDKPAGVQGVDLLWFDADGRITEHHMVYDGATILSQLGLSKQKARPIPPLPPSPQTFTSTGSSDEQKNVDLAKATNSAIENKKEADFLAVLADNVEYDDMTQPQTAKGKADAKKFFKEMTTGFPDAKHETSNAWAIDDFVVTEQTMTGIHKGTFFGIAATKKPVTLQSVDILQYKDGKLVRGRSYANGADFAQQLGIAPKPGAKTPDSKPAASATSAPPAKN